MAAKPINAYGSSNPVPLQSPSMLSPHPTIITRPRLIRYTGTGAGLVDHPIASEHPARTTGKLASSTHRKILHPIIPGSSGTSMDRKFARTSAIPEQTYEDSVVRIGNWRETGIVREDTINQLRHKRDQGALVSTKIARKCARMEQPVKLSRTFGYGLPIMLQNVFTLGMLAVDTSDIPESQLYGHDDDSMSSTTSGSRRVNDEISSSVIMSPTTASPSTPSLLPSVRTAGMVSAQRQGESSPISLTCTYRNRDPVHRTVFVIERVQTWDGDKQPADQGAPVCYGDKVYIKSIHVLSDQSLYLHSELKSAYASAKHGKRYAPAHLLPYKSSGALWQFVTTNKEYTLEYEGRPVLPGQHVILSHCFTSNYLQVDPTIHYQNDFGFEMESSAKRGSEVTADGKAWIQWTVWVDDPLLVQDVDDLAHWQATVSKTPPS